MTQARIRGTVLFLALVLVSIGADWPTRIGFLLFYCVISELQDALP